jgi:hypothetical protein
MKKHLNKCILIVIGLALLYVVIFPSITPELAVRKSMFISHPIHAIFDSIEEGNIKDDPMYGDLYFANQLELSFIYVKKNKLGWYVTSSGTGP